MGHTGKPKRVALIGCSGVLGSIITETLAAQPALEVVAELASPWAEADAAIAGLSEIADIVVWNHADESRIAASLIEISHRHGPRVLATLGDGANASLWELVPHRTELGALSPATLVDSIVNGDGS